MTEQEAIAAGVVRNPVGVWEYDADHGDWQMRLPDGSLGDPESWTKVNGNYGPAVPFRTISAIIGAQHDEKCPGCRGSGLVWKYGSFAVRCRHCPQDMTRPQDSVGTGKVLVDDPYDVDRILAWLRKQFPNQVEVGLQDDLVGFPADAPAGCWVEIPVGSGRTSFIAPTLIRACERAVEAVDVAATRQDGQA